MTTLHQAAREGDIAQIAALLTEGSLIDARESPDLVKIPALLLAQGESDVVAAGFSFCRTPLMLAVMARQLEVVHLLISRGCQLRVKDAVGWTAFGLACREGFLPAAQALVEAGDKLTQKLPGGFSALQVAAQAGHPELVVWLLKRGAAVDAKSSRGESALLLAAQAGQTLVVEQLLQAGADPNLASRDGRAPLGAVVAKLDRRAISKSEASSGRFVSVQWTDEGIFALEPASECETLAGVRSLLKAGALVDGPAGGAALLTAAQFGLLEVARLLVDHGADPHQPWGNLDMTALEVAEANRRPEMVAFFNALPRRPYLPEPG